MSLEQIAVRVPKSLLGQLDELVANEAFESRAAAVRAGIEQLIASQRRKRIDEAIADGYRRIPPTPLDDEFAVSSISDAIVEEPW